jgi:hypothetical protein
VLAEINKLLAGGKYKPAEIVDWCVKLARIAEGYTSFEHPRVSPVEREDRDDYNGQVHADLSRLNAEQLIALKHLALTPPVEALQRFLRAPVPLIGRLYGEKRSQDAQAKIERDFGKLRRQQTGRGGPPELRTVLLARHDSLARGARWGDEPKAAERVRSPSRA